MGGAPDTIHATAVALGAHAALIRGPSGSGKSDLALRCLGLASSPLIPEPFVLVSDDRVELIKRDRTLYARPPAAIQGLIEVRGAGLFKLPFCSEARVALVVDLVAPDAVDRLPDARLSTPLQGIDVATVKLFAFEVSTPLKLALLLSGAERCSTSS